MLDYADVEKLLRQGWTQQQVADKYGVTQSAVSLTRARGWVKAGRTPARSEIP